MGGSDIGEMSPFFKYVFCRIHNILIIIIYYCNDYSIFIDIINEKAVKFIT